MATHRHSTELFLCFSYLQINFHQQQETMGPKIPENVSWILDVEQQVRSMCPLEIWSLHLKAISKLSWNFLHLLDNWITKTTQSDVCCNPQVRNSILTSAFLCLHPLSFPRPQVACPLPPPFSCLPLRSFHLQLRPLLRPLATSRPSG